MVGGGRVGLIVKVSEGFIGFGGAERLIVQICEGFVGLAIAVRGVERFIVRGQAQEVRLRGGVTGGRGNGDGGAAL